MKPIVRLFFIALAYCMPIAALADNKITVQGQVFDRASDTQLFVVNVRLLNAQDSTELVQTKADGEYDGPIRGQLVRKSIFIFPEVERNERYILEFTRENYEPLYLDLDPATVSSRVGNMNLGKIYMRIPPLPFYLLRPQCAQLCLVPRHPAWPQVQSNQPNNHELKPGAKVNLLPLQVTSSI